MNDLPSIPDLLRNTITLAREHRSETTPLFKRVFALVGIFFGVLILFAILSAIVLGKSMMIVPTVLGIIMLTMLPALYYLVKIMANAQEIGLAAVEQREPDQNAVRVWQFILFFVIVLLPSVFVLFIFKGTPLFWGMEILLTSVYWSTMYLAPMTVVASGTAPDGIQLAVTLFRSNPGFVAVTSMLGSAVTSGPMIALQLFTYDPSHPSMFLAILRILSSIYTLIVSIRYEPFYRAQIYDALVAPQQTGTQIAG
jgi:hypothetical protein